jgi:hypothetical protein
MGHKRKVTGNTVGLIASVGAIRQIIRQKSAEDIVANARGNARFTVKVQTFHKEEPHGSLE